MNQVQPENPPRTQNLDSKSFDLEQKKNLKEKIIHVYLN